MYLLVSSVAGQILKAFGIGCFSLGTDPLHLSHTPGYPPLPSALSLFFLVRPFTLWDLFSFAQGGAYGSKVTYIPYLGTDRKGGEGVLIPRPYPEGVDARLRACASLDNSGH